jgi:hypothetical protein
MVFAYLLLLLTGHKYIIGLFEFGFGLFFYGFAVFS